MDLKAPGTFAGLKSRGTEHFFLSYLNRRGIASPPCVFSANSFEKYPKNRLFLT